MMEQQSRHSATPPLSPMRPRIVQTYDYRDEDDKVLYQVVRFEPKDFRPRRPDGTGEWIWNLNGTRRVLYRLPELLETSRQDWLCLCEGEKDVETLRNLGFAGTTSGSSSSWRPEFAGYFAGRLVAVFADNDEPGRRFARAVAASLRAVAADVRIVEPPDLEEGQDVTDWVDKRNSLEPDVLRSRIIGMIDGAPSATVDQMELACSQSQRQRESLQVEQAVPFPVACLPLPVARFVGGAARAIGCDPSYVALPLLAGLASAIGNTRRIQLKRGWAEPAIVWAGIVGESGTLKSPALEIALRAIRKRQHGAIKRYVEAMAQYEVELMKYEKDLTTWKRSKEEGDPPLKPEQPKADRCWCDDTTMEALAVLLLQNPRGLLVVRDELAGWLGSFDRYAQGKGADAAKWLEMFGGRSIMVDRKTGRSKIVYVPRAAVSISGGIQPETLRRALGAEHRENGLAARLLLTCPPRQPKHWTDADIPPEMEESIERIFERLYSLQLVEQRGEERPLDLPLTPAAKRVWIKFYNEHAREQAELTGDLAAAWSKLEGYAARLALIVHLVRRAARDKMTLEDQHLVDEDSIRAGVELSEWFAHEARRVYAMLGESDEQRDQRRLVDKIRAKGGGITIRELQLSSRKFRTAEDAGQALEALVEAGLGRWGGQQPGSRGGRPTRRFVLSEQVDVYKTGGHTSESEGFVDVDGVTASRIQPKDITEKPRLNDISTADGNALVGTGKDQNAVE